jgi:hypothetical protein
MPNATVRAAARTLPEATPHPNAALFALAAQFEAALQAYHAFYHGGGTDDEAAAATEAVKAVAQKIIAVPGTDISIMRLKARVYLWAESTDLEKLAAEGGDWPSEAVLASLFRDLGVADLDARAQHEGARTSAPPASDTWFDAYGDLESQILDLTRMAEIARFHVINTFGSNSPDETEEGKREREIALFAVGHVERMAKNLEKAWDAGWSSAQSPA